MVREIASGFEPQVDLLGGWLEAVQPQANHLSPYDAYVDEEGRLKGLAWNPVGSTVLRVLGFRPNNYVGNVLITAAAAEMKSDEEEEEEVQPDIGLNPKQIAELQTIVAASLLKPDGVLSATEKHYVLRSP